LVIPPFGQLLVVVVVVVVVAADLSLYVVVVDNIF